jgi:hypothetical protein
MPPLSLIRQFHFHRLAQHVVILKAQNQLHVGLLGESGAVQLNYR